MRNLFFFLLTFFVFTPTAHAITTTKSIDEPRPIEQRQELREEKRQEIGRSVVENHANRLEKRFELYYGRFTNIIKRLESRLAIFAAEGKDIAPIEAKLKLAKETLNQAKSQSDASISSFRSISKGQFPAQRTEAFQARDQALEARRLFQKLQSQLHDIAVDMQKLIAAHIKEVED